LPSGSHTSYLFFQPNEWFYTRFLLPAIPIMLVFAAAIALAGIRALPAMWRTPAITVLSLLVGGASLHFADRNGVFDIRNQERKYPLAGEFVRAKGPANAFVLAAQHSGSIRYYANRPTLRWDLISPTRLDQALATFRGSTAAAGRRCQREAFASDSRRPINLAIDQLTPWRCPVTPACCVS
jgi:hypothetical protein